MIQELVCMDKIKAYATIHHLEYTTAVDPGMLLERHRTPSYIMDIDLRGSYPHLNELFLQFYGLGYEFAYVFKWTRDKDIFSQIMCDIDLNDPEKVIKVLLDALTNKDYIATKYGLR